MCIVIEKTTTINGIRLPASLLPDKASIVSSTLNLFPKLVHQCSLILVALIMVYSSILGTNPICQSMKCITFKAKVHMKFYFCRRRANRTEIIMIHNYSQHCVKCKSVSSITKIFVIFS